jgi:hypothetical protein
MKAIIGALFLVGINLIARPALADQMTLADLKQMCSTEDAVGKAACRFFILGAFEGLEMAGAAEPSAGKTFQERTVNKQFCTPEDLSQDEMVAVVKRLAAADTKKFPEDNKMPAISFVGSVIVTNYGCH